MVCTDAAGEGLNMQFAWRLLNWDIPWNPARLEQRMGRIHRYKQMHDPVYIINLVAGKTREGRVMKTLLGEARTHPQGTRQRQGLRRDRPPVRGRQHQAIHGEGRRVRRGRRTSLPGPGRDADQGAGRSPRSPRAQALRRRRRCEIRRSRTNARSWTAKAGGGSCRVMCVASSRSRHRFWAWASTATSTARSPSRCRSPAHSTFSGTCWRPTRPHVGSV